MIESLTSNPLFWRALVAAVIAVAVVTVCVLWDARGRDRARGELSRLKWGGPMVGYSRGGRDRK